MAVTESPRSNPRRKLSDFSIQHRTSLRCTASSFVLTVASLSGSKHRQTVLKPQPKCTDKFREELCANLRKPLRLTPRFAHFRQGDETNVAIGLVGWGTENCKDPYRQSVNRIPIPAASTQNHLVVTR